MIGHLATLADLIERAPRSAVELKSFGLAAGRAHFEPSDDFAAQHYQVLCHELMPAASVFLEPGAVMGGTVSDRAWTIMASAGFEPDTTSILADHLSSSLRFIRFLLVQGRPDDARAYLEEEILSWLPPFLDRLRTFEFAQMAQIAGALEDVVERIQLGSSNAAWSRPYTAARWKLLESAFSLDEERTSLAEIAEYLASHAASGLMIPKSLLAHEARSHRLPTGFGSRARTIEGMLRSAAQYDALGGICDFFDNEIAAHQATWNQWSTKGAAHWAAEWSQKLSKTQNVIRQLRQAESESA